jgi:hypothetical protein
MYLLFFESHIFLQQRKIMLTLMQWSSLQKSVSKFTPKKFYEIDPWTRTFYLAMDGPVDYHCATKLKIGPGNNLCHFKILYDNKYSFIIDIYFYATFSTQTSSACTPKTFLDTLSDVLDKC